MNYDPLGAPLVRYSFGADSRDRAIGRPVPEPYKPQVFQFDGIEYPADRVPWSIYKQLRQEFGYSQGWTFCRFGVRGDNSDKCIQAFGIVRGYFGIYNAPFIVVGIAGSREHTLSVLAHLPTGNVVGIFVNDQSAVAAAEIMTRLPLEWGSDADASWQEPMETAWKAWRVSGILPAQHYWAHDLASGLNGPRLNVWGMEAVNEPGKMAS